MYKHFESHCLYLSHSCAGGIDPGTDCSADAIDHAIVIVGYGTDETTQTPYWKIKNSWGTGMSLCGCLVLACVSPRLCGMYPRGKCVCVYVCLCVYARICCVFL